MGLAEVLSTVKELVLSPGQLIGDVVERERYLKNAYPSLGPEEAKDLAAIAPERLAIYTQSIFTAEASLLERYFPVTTSETLRTLRGHQQNADLTVYGLAILVHSVSPWRGIHSPSFGESLIDFISKYPLLQGSSAGALTEIANLELATLKIRKAPNSKHTPCSKEAIEELSSLMVGDLLLRRFSVPSLVEGLRCEWDIGKFRELVLAGEDSPKLNRLEKAHCLLAGRATDYGVQWVAVGSSIYESLLKRRGGLGQPLEDLAEIFIAEASVETKREEELFTEFLSMVVSLLSVGVLVPEPA